MSLKSGLDLDGRKRLSVLFCRKPHEGPKGKKNQHTPLDIKHKVTLSERFGFILSASGERQAGKQPHAGANGGKKNPPAHQPLFPGRFGHVKSHAVPSLQHFTHPPERFEAGRRLNHAFNLQASHSRDPSKWLVKVLYW